MLAHRCHPLFLGRRSRTFGWRVVAEDERSDARSRGHSPNIGSIGMAGENMTDDFWRLRCAGALPECPRHDFMHEDISSPCELHDVLRVPRIAGNDDRAIASIETIGE